MLGKLSTMHVSKNVKKNQVPFNLPQVDPNIVSISVLRGILYTSSCVVPPCVGSDCFMLQRVYLSLLHLCLVS